MKTIGMLGGMSWESTALYYRSINEQVKARLGGFHSASIAMVSVDFEEIEVLQRENDWEACGRILADKARVIEAAGADFLLICTNTMHKVADDVAAAIDIPLLHLADATARRIHASGHSKVGLLGTRYTMEHDFYKGRLESSGLEVLVPEQADRDMVHDVIFNELCHGKVVEESRAEFLRIIDELKQAGAECVIEGCTEIVMLIQQEHTDMPLFDTTAIHVEEAVTEALQ